MHTMNFMVLWIKKKAMEVQTDDLFQYKSSHYKRVQNQLIYMNIHMLNAHSTKRNKSKNT